MRCGDVPVPRWLCCACTVMLSGCAGVQSSLAPGGREAERVATLFWWMAAGALLVGAAVIALAVYCDHRSAGAPNRRRDMLLIVGGGARRRKGVCRSWSPASSGCGESATCARMGTAVGSARSRSLPASVRNTWIARCTRLQPTTGPAALAGNSTPTGERSGHRADGVPASMYVH